jgi:multidrug efflux pump subunit AcrA (membrane-fusion protein)
MKENIKKRKWVIKAAVVFFVILLLLTFFSNTIMNYSLPQVSTQYVQSDTIVSKIRGTGMVTASNPYNVTVTGTRKVKLVAVKEGDTVSEGSLLVMFEDGDSTELSDAAKTLEQAKTDYDRYIITNEIKEDIISRVESGNKDYSSYKSSLATARASVDAAQAQVDDYTSTAKGLQAQVDAMNNTVIDVSAEQAALDNANTALKDASTTQTVAETNVASLQEQYDLLQESGDTSSVASSLASAKAALASAQNQVTQCQANVDKAQEALTAKQNNTENTSRLAALQAQLNDANTNLSNATDTLTKAQEAHQKILDAMNQETELSSMYQAIQTAQTQVNTLNANGTGNKIVSASAGTVTGVYVTKGQETTEGEPLIVISNDTDGYTADMTVTSEQARRIKAGDTVDIAESWYYSNVSASVTGIKNDTSNPGKSKIVQLKIEGDVSEGDTLNFAIGDKNSSYDFVVPNGAVREDKDGKFILIIRSKSSPLGNRYYAKRVNVEVLASDDTKSAVSGDLEGYEYVITTSTKSINPGDQVRLNEKG